MNPNRTPNIKKPMIQPYMYQTDNNNNNNNNINNNDNNRTDNNHHHHHDHIIQSSYNNMNNTSTVGAAVRWRLAVTSRRWQHCNRCL